MRNERDESLVVGSKSLFNFSRRMARWGVRAMEKGARACDYWEVEGVGDRDLFKGKVARVLEYAGIFGVTFGVVTSMVLDPGQELDLEVISRLERLEERYG